LKGTRRSVLPKNSFEGHSILPRQGALLEEESRTSDGPNPLGSIDSDYFREYVRAIPLRECNLGMLGKSGKQFRRHTTKIELVMFD
jgi:hypothetical protein